VVHHARRLEASRIVEAGQRTRPSGDFFRQEDADSSGSRRTAAECSQQVVDELYVDNSVTHPIASQRRPARGRFEA
jgi:hypothetical protein